MTMSLTPHDHSKITPKKKVEKGTDGFWRTYCIHFGHVMAFKTWRECQDFADKCAYQHPRVMAFQ